MYDPGFGVNNFNKPKYYSESQTTANNIMMILYGRPGFYPSIPDLGMDVSRLLNIPLDDIDCESLKSELTIQCNRFIENVRDGTFDVFKSLLDNKPLIIFAVPVEVKRVPKRIAIGISTDSNGDLIYRTTFADD